ncbi:DUF2218 domain-containing protein [Pseudonocardia sp. H11422]|uniref:DUF2218 domain-containing protein n=1 Tax=Pseudonocardia sp. H11422 TaxID=2835866 RepID=UPI001BDC023E|nr:DUF2218 domain-containing protein [Pseudonocardia sp. H11422]
MLTSTAVIRTDSAVRYAKQLLAHLGHKNVVEPLEGAPHAGRIRFAYGSGTVRPEGDLLVLDAAAADAAALARVEDVLARHLERFGARRAIAVTWEREAEAAGGG